MKKHKKKSSHTVFDNTDSQADDSAMVTPSQFEKGAALSSTRIDEHSPESNKKRKKKKDKHSLDGSLNEVEPGTSMIEDMKHKNSKKKKKNKHGLDESIPETVKSENDKESMAGSSGDRDSCRKRKISDTHIESFTGSSFEESCSGSSKKKKIKKEKHSLEGSHREVHEDSNEFKTPMKKKKKKHKHKLEQSESEHNLTEEIPESVQSNCASQSNMTGEMNSLSSESLEQSGTHNDMESDEGYYSKKSKKKHKRKTQ